MKFPYLFSALLVLLTSAARLNAQKIKVIETNQPVSIRGLSIVNNKVAWLSSSSGYTAITHDGGHTWNWQQVKGFEKADFRDIEGFSDKEAIIMSSGTPALILRTTDGGASWDVKYQNDDKAYFFDAIDFSDKKHGLILGDPVDKKFLLLETNDGGESWHKFANLPDAMEGEAAFAASGTCIRINEAGGINIVSGGKISRSIFYNSPTNKWISEYLPIKQGKDSQGAFSVSQDAFVFVGGDYSLSNKSDSTSCLIDPTLAGVRNGLRVSLKFPFGYQSCVEYLYGKKQKFPADTKSVLSGTYISTGTAGSHISDDGGYTWRCIDSTSFNVCRKAKKGKLVLLAGDKGKIGIFTL